MARNRHSVSIGILVLFAMLLSAGFASAQQGQRKVQRDPQQAQTAKQDLQQLRTRLMNIKDEASLDTALANLTQNSRITQDQAAKLKQQWLKQHSKANMTQILTRLQNIKDEAQLDQALSNLQTQGRITQNQATRLKAQWQKQQLKGRPVTALRQIRGIKDEAKVDEILAGMVSNGKITQQQAAKIKEQWRKRLWQFGGQATQLPNSRALIMGGSREFGS